ncbi:MAG TPA: DEAD/DEAH box helicase family protein [Syntrophales bacterium]|nr:DEAD/DEAH box helicase family protein [Syntrophales bacterium]
MKLQFDAQQQFQIDAVNAVVDIFDGQPLHQGDFEIRFETSYEGVLSGQVQTELGMGNQLLLNDETILANVHGIQDINAIDLTPALQGYHFSVEMETGTGKTYVYLRTIFELSRKYGFKKYVIVVPSVAIREGVLKNLEITKEHFKALFNNIEYEYFVYDSQKINRLRQFAVSNSIQIMVINIDAFRKNFTGTDDERKSNVIFKENDKLSGRQPIEFITATNPIVIIDEPQSVDNTPKAQEAIKTLNPLYTLRYSATHRNLYNHVYKLDPIKAYEMRLVKQIVVAEAKGANTFNAAYAKLVEVDNTKGIYAKVTIHENKPGGVREKTVKVKQRADLFILSNEREAYRDGYVVAEISAEPGSEFVGFSNGRILRLGEEQGGIREDLMKVQIRNTIRKHLEKELQCRDKGIKVLSLFFIDRVANYRAYDEGGKPVKGKFAQWFEEHYNELIAQPRFQGLLLYPVDKLHDGYFSQDKKGVLKDTRGNSEADEDTYTKIMRNKEQLLSLDEPLRFIFSHSALREGWDNPNVFQICTLNETASILKKRQEIGRGLRLPVNQNGERVFDENLNKLTVVANESYEDFARTLQREYEEDCGVTFGKIPITGFARIMRVVNGEESLLGREASEKIWNTAREKGYLDGDGRITSAFKPGPGFVFSIGEEFQDVEPKVLEVMESWRVERHIKKDEDERPLRINKQVFLDEDFKKLWDRIKLKTTYSVEYSTEVLTARAVEAIGKIETIEPIRISYREALLNTAYKGIDTAEIRSSITDIAFAGVLPDIIAYIQKETELTRSTIARILIESGRLAEFAVNPQRFMDAVVSILKRELHRLMIDGIKYEKISDQEYSMRLFEDKEIISYLTNRLEVKKSVYDAVVYDSEIERKFAEELDRREDIKLFVKLPGWFKVETPIGEYNPDWAILKHDDTVLYLVRETKSTKDFEKLCNTEAEKIRCGRRHFEELGVNFDVVVTAGEV